MTQPVTKSNSSFFKRILYCLTHRRVQCPFCLHKMWPLRIDKREYICSNKKCESHKQEIKLPAQVFTHKLFPIAIVGPGSSGKTYYLTSVLHEFMNGKPWCGEEGYWDLNEVHFAKDEALELETNSFMKRWNAIFRKRNLDDDSLRSTTPDVWLSPLLLSIDLKWAVKLKHPFLKRKWLLAFHDVAGEVTTNPDARMKLFKRYGALGAAKGIIVIVEPTELPDVKEKLESGGVIPLTIGDKTPSLESVKGVRTSWHQRKKPVAICLSKSDLLLRDALFAPTAHLRQNEQTDLHHPGMLQLRDIQAMSNEVKDAFRQFKAEDYLPLMQRSFKYHSFFAMSALGRECMDYIHKKILPTAQLKPIRVMDPILWILWQEGVIDGE